MKIKNIIWDFDGTLYDTYGAIVEVFSKLLCEQYGIDVAADQIFQLVKIDTRHCTQELAKEYGLNENELLILAKTAYDQINTEIQKPFEYVRDVCELLDATGGANFLVTHRDRQSLDTMLDAYEFQDYFKEIVTADDGYPKKPSPESFNFVIEKFALPLNETWGVGDRDLDVGAANSADICSIYFCQNGGKHNAATVNISSFQQLCELIKPVTY